MSDFIKPLALHYQNFIWYMRILRCIIKTLRVFIKIIKPIKKNLVKNLLTISCKSSKCQKNAKVINGTRADLSVRAPVN